jgi:uncharacterized protein YjbI with pentapeptide repeats
MIENEKEHEEILKDGAEAWKKWRDKNLNVMPQLSEADLVGWNLKGANLHGADLRGADLSNAILIDADLVHANLMGARLSGANLSGAKFGSATVMQARFSHAILDGANFRDVNAHQASFRDTSLISTDFSRANLSDTEFTNVDFSTVELSEANITGMNIKGSHNINLSGTIVYNLDFELDGCQKGLNGFYNKDNDSAALMHIIPPGNSMQGSNSEVIIESLKRARKLHGFSLTLAGIALFIYILKLPSIKFPNQDFEVSPDQYWILAMPICIGLLFLVATFLNDAFNGIKYLFDRKSAMQVGFFPWVLSKYSGEGRFSKIQSISGRLILSFHPLLYLTLWGNWGNFPLWLYLIFMVVIMALSYMIFRISQNFQKPILFDSESERQRQSDIEKLINAAEGIKEHLLMLKRTIEISQAR